MTTTKIYPIDDDELLSVSINGIHITVYIDPYHRDYCLIYHNLTDIQNDYYASMYSKNLEYLIRRAQRMIMNLQDEVE